MEILKEVAKFFIQILFTWVLLCTYYTRIKMKTLDTSDYIEYGVASVIACAIMRIAIFAYS